MANIFMCSIEEKLANENKLPDFYRRCVDNTFSLVPDFPTVSDFLATLDNAHQAIQFTMETAVNNELPFAGMVIKKSDNRLNSCPHRKKTNKGLYYQRHIDNRYKPSLLRTTIGRASRLSFSPELFRQECKELKSVFVKLKYPEKLIDFTFARFKATLEQTQDSISLVDNPVRIVLPFKDRKSADYVRRELRNVSRKIGHVLQPAYQVEKSLKKWKLWKKCPL